MCRRMTFLREPLLHFAVIGAILFGGYGWLNRGKVEANAVEPVRITEGDVQWLKQTWSSQWLREPTANEIRDLISNLVDEELLAREAREIGLEKDDTIIRRRLAQKLKFLVEDTVQLAEPTEGELRQFHAANSARFETPARLSFRQVYFSPQERKDVESDALATLAKLNANPESDLGSGDRLQLGDSFADIDELGVSSMFGQDFAREVFALEPGEWRGPLKSGYGLHLVLVWQRTPAEPKPFESVRDEALTEWRRQKQDALSREYLAELRRKYGVELDDNVEVSLRSEPAQEMAAQ